MINFYESSKSPIIRAVIGVVLLLVDIVSLRVLTLAIKFKGFETYAVSLFVSLLVLILLVRLVSKGFSNKANIFVLNHNVKDLRTLRKNIRYLSSWYRSSSKLIDDNGKPVKKEEYVNYILNKHYIDSNLYDDLIDNSILSYERVSKGLI